MPIPLVHYIGLKDQISALAADYTDDWSKVTCPDCAIRYLSVMQDLKVKSNIPLIHYLMSEEDSKQTRCNKEVCRFVLNETYSDKTAQVNCEECVASIFGSGPCDAIHPDGAMVCKRPKGHEAYEKNHCNVYASPDLQKTWQSELKMRTCEKCGTEYKYILDHGEAACRQALGEQALSREVAANEKLTFDTGQDGRYRINGRAICGEPYTIKNHMCSLDPTHIGPHGYSPGTPPLVADARFVSGGDSTYERVRKFKEKESTVADKAEATYERRSQEAMKELHGPIHIVRLPDAHFTLCNISAIGILKRNMSIMPSGNLKDFCPMCMAVFDNEPRPQPPLTLDGNVHGPAQPERETSTVNHPPHYNAHPSGIECITIVEYFNFNIGNAIKYLWRAGYKSENPLEDLKKAQWYVSREIERLEKEDVKLNERKQKMTVDS